MAWVFGCTYHSDGLFRHITQSAALARIGAAAASFTFRRRITGQDFLGLGDEAACDALVQAVHDAHQCPLSLLLLDDLEVRVRVRGWLVCARVDG